MKIIESQDSWIGMDIMCPACRLMFSLEASDKTALSFSEKPRADNAHPAWKVRYVGGCCPRCGCAWDQPVPIPGL